MKQLFTRCAFAALLTLGLASCTKDDKDNKTVTPDTPTGIVGTWKVVSITADRELDFNGNGVPTNDAWSFAPDCAKDNLWIFNSNGNFIYDAGATKCDPDEEQSISTPYQLSGTELTIDYGQAFGTISKVDNTTMEMIAPNAITTVDANGQVTDSIPYIATYIFARQ